MLKSVFIILSLCMGLMLPIKAFGGETYPGRWWNVPQIASMLELTDGQKRQLDEMYDENRNKLRELRDSVEDERDRLYQVLDRESFTEEDVSNQLRRLETARAKLSAERTRYVVEIRRLLGLKRFQILNQYYKKSRDSRPGDDRNMGDTRNFNLHLGPAFLNFRFRLR